MIQFMPANHSNTNRVITILIHSDKKLFQNVFVTLLRRVAKDVTSSLLSWHKRYDFNAANFRRHSQWKRNELEYVFHGLTSLSNCKDSTDNKIPLQPYSEKENKRNSCTLFLKCTLKYPYTAPTNIRTLKYLPMCYKLSVFSIVELFLGSCL